MEKTSWDLSPLFKSNAEAEAALDEFKAYIDKSASYQGKLHDEKELTDYLRP